MLATKRSVRTAGGSAGQRFKTLAKAWRRRALRPVFLACSGLVIGFAIAGTVVTGQAKFWLGALAGGTMALYMALRESPPWHIEKWRVGEEGERRTAKALRQLPGREWKAWHDLPGKNGTNVDHVVLGPAGLFLLDSKNYSGEASIEAGELRVRWLEDPEDGWVCHGMVSRMRAASAEFKERIEAATGVRVLGSARRRPVDVLPSGCGSTVRCLLCSRRACGRLAPQTQSPWSLLRPGEDQ